ncbi:MAG TPA: GNAT family N-acetyltransferase [Acidimicrobiales bacterium]|nr:GNAT family N-acetyltransferase [Acidimicrobiales bacterium]
MSAFELRSVAEAELDDWWNTLGTAFGRRNTPEQLEREIRAVGMDRLFGVYDGKEVVGTCAAYPLELTMPGLARHPMAGVTSVTVLPSHRRRGILRSMMIHQLGELHERGEFLAGLTASEGGIYGRFGYAPASFACTYELNKTKGGLARPIGDLATGTVRMVNAEQAEQALPELWDEARKSRPGDIGILPVWWEDYFHDSSRADEAKTRFYAVYEEEGRIDGCAVYQVVRDPEPPRNATIVLEDLVTTGIASYAALWNFLIGIDLAVTLRARGRPVDELLRLLLADGRQLRTQARYDDLWLRIVVVTPALEARSYVNGKGLRIVIGVSDATCSWNAGTYELEIDDAGLAHVTRQADAEPDLTVDVSSLGAVLLGGVRMSSYVRAGAASENAPGAAKLADTIFSSDIEPYLASGF